MKEKLSRNLGLKLISLFCAFFVWLAVVNVANPVQVKTKEVPVTVTNESVLERSNLTYEILGKKTAIISYQIKAKDAYKIKPSDFNAYADLSEMYDVTGAIPIKVEVLNNDELLKDVAVKSPEVLKIRTEELQTKKFDLTARSEGKPADGYVPGEITLDPDYVYVRGPISQVGQISEIGIDFNIEGAVADVAGTAKPAFYDANGNSLPGLEETVKVLGGEISYSMQVLKVKSLPLDFVVTGEVADGYRRTGIECSVKEVNVAGLKSALASLSTFTVQSPELNIQGATKDKVCEIDLKQYLPANVRIAGMENTTVTVTLKVEPLEDRVYTVETKNIELTGGSAQFDYEMTEDKTEIKVRGLKEDLDSLSPEKMTISADVSGLTLGMHPVTATLKLDDAYEIMEYPVCSILVEEKADEAGNSKAESQSETKESAGNTDKAESKEESQSETKAETKADN